MGGIFGWVRTPLEPDQARSAWAAMAGPGYENQVSTAAQFPTHSDALGVRPGLLPVSQCRSDSLFVAVEGRPYWTFRDLQQLAVERGAAAAIAEAYRRLGADCLQDVRGPFALAVLDTRQGAALIAVDRLGVRNLCYAGRASGLVFGSSAESVAAHPMVGREPSRQAMFDYLHAHVVPSPSTIFAGVEKLLPGECLLFNNGALQKRVYWRLHYRDEQTQSTHALNARFRRLLRDAAARSIDGDERIGAFLSGGTDSSTVAGVLTELTGRSVRTYSIGFAATGFDEMEYARITARHFGTSAHEYYLKPQDVLDAIPIIARSYDEPFGNESAVPTYYCARMAHADGVRVMLAGDGGDELFGGNARYARQKLFELYGAVPPGIRSRVLEPLAQAGAHRIAPLRKLHSYIEQAKVPLPDRLETYNFLHRSPLTEIFEPGFLAEVDAARPLRLAREVYASTLSGSPVNRMMHLDLKLTLADNDLRKVSRMCEVAGIEARYPLLDEALVEFSGELPASLKVRGFKLRYFFKQALKDFLPPETIAKTKHGFGMPFGIWLRDYAPLRDAVGDSLEAFARRGIMKRDYIAALVRQHQSTHATYFGVMIWVIMMLERWLGARKL